MNNVAQFPAAHLSKVKDRNANRNVPGGSKGPAWNFLQEIGVARPKNEEQAVLELLEIHRRWRENEYKRIDRIAALPKWKKFIVSVLNLPI